MECPRVSDYLGQYVCVCLLLTPWFTALFVCSSVSMYVCMFVSVCLSVFECVCDSVICMFWTCEHFSRDASTKQRHTAVRVWILQGGTKNWAILFCNLCLVFLERCAKKIPLIVTSGTSVAKHSRPAVRMQQLVLYIFYPWISQNCPVFYPTLCWHVCVYVCIYVTVKILSFLPSMSSILSVGVRVCVNKVVRVCDATFSHDVCII